MQVTKGFAALFLFVCPFAWAAPADTGADDSAEARQEERRVCKRTKQIGSNLPTRICKTKRQWDEMAQASRQAINDLNRTSQMRDD